MSDEITCPDCGGLIGAVPGQGRQVCRCFEPRKTAVAAPAFDPGESLADDAGGSQGSTVAHQATPGEKVCHACGKNVAGHRRFKDSRGYMCLPCSEAERLANADNDLIPCPECNRKLRVEGITTYNGEVMCKRCAAEKKELNKFKPLTPDLLKRHGEEEKRSFRNLLIVAGVLLLFVLLATAKLITNH